MYNNAPPSSSERKSEDNSQAAREVKVVGLPLQVNTFKHCSGCCGSESLILCSCAFRELTTRNYSACTSNEICIFMIRGFILRPNCFSNKSRFSENSEFIHALILRLKFSFHVNWAKSNQNTFKVFKFEFEASLWWVAPLFTVLVTLVSQASERLLPLVSDKTVKKCLPLN